MILIVIEHIHNSIQTNNLKNKEWGWGKGNGINGAEQEKEPEIGEYEDTRKTSVNEDRFWAQNSGRASLH